MATVKIQGEVVAAAKVPELLESKDHEIRELRTVLVGTDRSDAELVEIPGVQGDDLVELHLDDGSVVVTTYEEVRKQARKVPGYRSEASGEDILPTFLDFGDTDRGAGGVVLRILRVFRVEPDKKLADLATAQAVDRIEARLTAAPGLYVVEADGTLGAEVKTLPPPAGNAPLLVFLHGTASSTMGSFSGLFGERSQDGFQPSAEWKELRRHYDGRIYALEHRTLSASPAENALDLARVLPEGAEVHLVSHSRGGLIGELLCRGGFDEKDLDVFKRGKRPGQVPEEIRTLTELGKELALKQLRVGRFVRVACPAAGTELASNRLDTFLSVLLSLLRYAAPPLAQPAIEVLTSILLEVASRRAKPEELPGLEAQRPESPYAHFLNRKLKQVVDQDLCVIAGDLRRGNVLQSLRALVGYGYFWQKNDLVVHTRAMYAGLERKQGWVSFHEGAEVTHFSYFSQAASRERLLAALRRSDRAERPKGFEDLREALKKQSFSAWRELPEADRGKPVGTVLFVPDLYMTRLAADGEVFWPSAAALTEGGLVHLRPAEAVTLDNLVDLSVVSELESALDGDHEVVPVPYDWRLGAKAAADALAETLAARGADALPVAVVAHGLGALGVLELLSRNQESAEGADPLRGRPIVLVAPPLEGSEAVFLAGQGEGRLVRMLQCLDAQATTSDIASLLMGLPGFLDLLPSRCFEPAWRGRASFGGADTAALESIAARRARYREIAVKRDRTWFLLGAAEVSPDVESIDPLRIKAHGDGDGWMRNPGSLPEARVWYAPALHERLLYHPIGSAVTADLVRHGSSSRGSRQRPKDGPRRQPPPFIFPSQADLEGELVAEDAGGEVAPDFILRVKVAHGSLDRLLGRPVLVGHYAADGIWGAESFLDRCLGHRLRRRYALGSYPGPVGTGVYVPAPRCHPEGALIVGLGDIGDLTPGRLSLGVERAVIEWALHAIERLDTSLDESPDEKSEPRSLRLASLLVGTRGGGSLTIRQSMVAVLRGVLRARRLLARDGLDRYVKLDDVVFVELWSDIAVSAAHELQFVEDDSGLGLERGEHVLPVLPLQPLRGARGNSRSVNEWRWWRRVIIREGKGALQGSLQFVTLGERSRAEERMVFTQRPLVDELIERAPKDKAEMRDGRLVNALFELLLPVPLKETVFEGHDLVLVVDSHSGRYPWELLARRSAAGIEPLISRVKVVRQFQTGSFHERVAQSRSNHALVIGEPDLGDPQVSGFPPLDGATQEAEVVIEELKQHRYSVEESVSEGSHDVIQKLFLRDYRVLHVAAHGVFERVTSPSTGKLCTRCQTSQDGNQKVTGVVIGRSRDGVLSVLSADIFRQLPAIPELVFLNCCHLGSLGPKDERKKVEDPEGLRDDAERTRLAASVAEALMELGVRALVVAGWAINDQAANRFAREFYRRMLRGEPFGDAVHEARCAVWKEYPFLPTWGAYQAYGDPEFRLASPPGGNGSEPSYVSERELIDAVTDISADASSIGVSARRLTTLQNRLLEYEKFLDRHPEWRSGELLNELAEAWKATGDFERAIARYREALGAEDARSPLKAAEQLCNLLDRLAYDEREVAPGTLRVETEAVKKRRSPAWGWLEWVEQMGKSAERANLRGGILKRAAVKAKTSERRVELLKEAAAAYEEAIQLGEKAPGQVHYYPGLNAATLQWLGERDAWRTKKSTRAPRKLIRDRIEPSRESARAEAARGEDLWNALALCEADLLEALVLDKFNDRKAKELAKVYESALRNFGKASEHESARRQVEILRDLDDRVGREPAFQIILDTFTKE